MQDAEAQLSLAALRTGGVPPRGRRSTCYFSGAARKALYILSTLTACTAFMTLSHAELPRPACACAYGFTVLVVLPLYRRETYILFLFTFFFIPITLPQLYTSKRALCGLTLKPYTSALRSLRPSAFRRSSCRGPLDSPCPHSPTSFSDTQAFKRQHQASDKASPAARPARPSVVQLRAIRPVRLQASVHSLAEQRPPRAEH